ncbi:MAG: histidinol dehydrogenase [Chitinivibrionales bacterium]
MLANAKKLRGLRDEDAQRTVEKIIADVRKKGDRALFAYTKQFDKVTLSGSTVRINNKVLVSQARKAPKAFKIALEDAARNIRTYHAQQKGLAFSIKTNEGTLAQIIRPLSRVGVYVPGGYTTYPSSILMGVIPAQIAGVKEIAVATPPRGELDPKIAYALNLSKITEIYQIGGVQAIAAFAYGTESVKPVDKIVGPGNVYVALAKKMVYGAVDIDTIAGPSEVVILADETAKPEWVTLDLLAQAEHGSGNESARCVTESYALAEKIRDCCMTEILRSPIRGVFEKLSPNSICICVTQTRDESIGFINECAPEHLQIITKTARKDVRKIINASAIFCGPYSPVALGDYYIGTNHILPTGGAARYASPLGVESFLKRMSVAEISAEGLRRCAGKVSMLARSENFIHHALSVERRAEQLKKREKH